MKTPMLIALLFSIAGWLVDATAAAAPKNKQARRDITNAAPANATVQRDIVYATVKGVALKLDVYSPKAAATAPRPLVVYVHGGGWRNGTKATGTYITEVTADLVSRGFVMASIDYRLAPDAKWPDFIHDCKAAIRFLRAHAAEYGVDPNRVGVWGGSAGGHLVALLGATDAKDGLEGDGGSPGQSSRVQAVVDLFGPSDLTRMMTTGEGATRRAEAFGATDNLVRQASPIQYVSKDDPPFLILHGDSDQLVPLEQSQMLYEKLKAVGVPATLIVVKGGAHGLNNPGISPTKPELVKKIGEFFDAQLRNPGK